MPIPSVALRTTDLLLGQNVLYCKSCLLLGPVDCSSKEKSAVRGQWIAQVILLTVSKRLEWYSETRS